MVLQFLLQDSVDFEHPVWRADDAQNHQGKQLPLPKPTTPQVMCTGTTSAGPAMFGWKAGSNPKGGHKPRNLNLKGLRPATPSHNPAFFVDRPCLNKDLALSRPGLSRPGQNSEWDLA